MSSVLASPRSIKHLHGNSQSAKYMKELMGNILTKKYKHPSFYCISQQAENIKAFNCITFALSCLLTGVLSGPLANPVLLSTDWIHSLTLFSSALTGSTR